VVLKPASDAVACALLLEEILGKVLPAGVFTVVAGPGATGQAVIELADVVSFTGSTAVGLEVAKAATARGIPSQAEMGGLNASIVLPDADVEAAAKVIAGAAMGFAGQKCTATSRVIAVGDPAPLTDALVAAVEALPTGDPAEQSTVVGPVINPPALDDVVGAAREVANGGGRLATGGQRLDGPGLFVTPTVVTGLEPDARLAQEEVFGPIAAVLRADSAEQAVEISNAVPYGLVTSVFTRDLDAALTVVEGLETGMIRINQPTSGVDFHAPFGGEKQSSFGPREQGKAARELYTSSHTITIGP
jgi:alpha-ketoglutaric semialdehyde dehydrogenase